MIGKINRNKGNSPCFKCQKREISCHDRCPTYKEYKENNEIERLAREKRAKLNNDLTDIKIKSIARAGK